MGCLHKASYLCLIRPQMAQTHVLEVVALMVRKNVIRSQTMLFLQIMGVPMILAMTLFGGQMMIPLKLMVTMIPTIPTIPMIPTMTMMPLIYYGRKHDPYLRVADREFM